MLHAALPGLRCLAEPHFVWWRRGELFHGYPCNIAIPSPLTAFAHFIISATVQRTCPCAAPPLLPARAQAPEGGGPPEEVTRLVLAEQGGVELVMRPGGAYVSTDCPVLRHVITACLTAQLGTL